MGRPSKLSDAQWAEIGRRLAKGEGVSALAREFGVSKPRISERFSKRTETIKAVAHQVADAERALEALPVSERYAARSLADDLKVMKRNLVMTARLSSETAAELAVLANEQVKSIRVIDPVGHVTIDRNALSSVTLLTAAAQQAADLPFSLAAVVQRPGESLDYEDKPGRPADGGKSQIELINDPDQGDYRVPAVAPGATAPLASDPQSGPAEGGTPLWENEVS